MNEKTSLIFGSTGFIGSKTIDFLLGPFSKFKSIEGNSVAKAMVLETKKSKSGINYFYFNEMIQSLINATPSE